MKRKIIISISMLAMLLVVEILLSINSLKNENNDVFSKEVDKKITTEERSNNESKQEVIPKTEDITLDKKNDTSKETVEIHKKDEKSAVHKSSDKTTFKSSSNPVDNTTTYQQQKDTSAPSRPEKVEEQPDVESNDENKTTEKVKEPQVISFYASITHGKKEFATESEALERGLEIANNELNYVMNYNAEHPESQIKPDINYYRVYPSVIDENGKTWYYLHFFCQSGNDKDEKLKKLY